MDEPDRLKTAGLEQLRDLYDRRHIGLVLIGMPGLQKRLARYAQLYSRVGFVHQFEPLSGREFQNVVERQWVQLGLDSAIDHAMDATILNAIARATGGNFRLLQRLFAQIDRVLTINNLERDSRRGRRRTRKSRDRRALTFPHCANYPGSIAPNSVQSYSLRYD